MLQQCGLLMGLHQSVCYCTNLVLRSHLVKLIYAQHALVCQHQRSCLENKLSSHGILDHRHGEACGAAGAPAHIHTTRRNGRDCLHPKLA